MPYALVIQPQLVSILDFHGNPADVWVVEVPSWVAKFLSESSLDDENQIEAEPPRNPFSVYYAPRSNDKSFHLRVNKFHVNNVSHWNPLGCKVEEIVDQEEQVPLVQDSPNNFHGIWAQ